MAPEPLMSAFSSIAAYEDAVVARRLHENEAFRDIAGYATRGHALSLQIVREDYPKWPEGRELQRGDDYGLAKHAADSYAFLLVFADERMKGVDYVGALRAGLRCSDAAQREFHDVHDGLLEDSLRECNAYLQHGRNESGKARVTHEVMTETLYAVKFLHMHLDQHCAIPEGSSIGIKKIQGDIRGALDAKTGLDQAARKANTTPEFLYMTNVQNWLQQQMSQNKEIQENFLVREARGFQLDENVVTLLETGAVYEEICYCLRSQLASDMKTGLYLENFAFFESCAAKEAPFDPAVVLHNYMQQFLDRQIGLLQSGDCRPQDGPLIATAFSALMREVDKQFPLRKPPAQQGVPKGPALI